MKKILLFFLLFTEVKSYTQSINIPFSEMVYVQSGSFEMSFEPIFAEKGVAHKKKIDVKAFYIGKYEVTQRQWLSIMGSNPSHFDDCLDCPVENVSWVDVQAFLDVLNSKNGGKKYRLPTEIEWTYAAGGGGIAKRTIFGNGKDTLDKNDANFAGCFHRIFFDTELRRNTGGTVPVNSFQPNSLGLYNMSGNVWEMCSDLYRKSFRIIRGGSYDASSEECKVSERSFDHPSKRLYSKGFRLAMDAN